MKRPRRSNMRTPVPGTGTRFIRGSPSRPGRAGERGILLRVSHTDISIRRPTGSGSLHGPTAFFAFPGGVAGRALRTASGAGAASLTSPWRDVTPHGQVTRRPRFRFVQLVRLRRRPRTPSPRDSNAGFGCGETGDRGRCLPFVYRLVWRGISRRVIHRVPPDG